MVTTVLTAVAAAAASTFDDSLGVNTHIDFSWTSYDDLTAVQNALTYLGVTNVRDSIDNPADLAKFAALNQDLGVKFDFYIAPGDVGMPWQLQQIESDPAIVRFVEGPNESDNWPVTYDGLTGFAATEAEQQALYASVKATLPGIPVIGPGFGQLGSFGQVGDLAASADYGNAHIYFGTGNSPGDQNWIQTLLADAALVVPGKPAMTTETGYYTSTDPSDPNGVDQTVQAKYILDDVMDQFSAGVSMDYLYELVDEQADPGNTNPQLHFGLFNSDWTPKPAAVAIHNLLQLLQDPGVAGFTPGTLDYGLTGMTATDHSLVLEKSDGTFVLVLWNDARLSGPVTGTDITVAPSAVTLTLGDAASLIDVYDPLSGTDAMQSAANTSQITLSVPDHPILVEIGPNAGAAIAQGVTPPAPVLSPASPTGVTVNVPAALTVTAGQASAVTGVSITDPWAAGMLGGMALNLSTDGGTLTMTDAAGNPVAGSGTSAITFDGTLFQLNTDLAYLSYTPPSGAGTDTITVDVWDPAGLEATETIAVTVGASSPPVVIPPATPPVVIPPATPPVVIPPATPPVVIGAADLDPVITTDNTVISATAGNHSIFLAGTGDSLTATGGKETVMAFVGGNTITTGAGNDTIRIAGSGNVINAGAGANEIDDSGGGNTIVLPAAGNGVDDIYGYVLQAGDILDMRAMLAATAWDGNVADLANFVRIRTTDGADAVISVVPSGSPSGAATRVATLYGAGPVARVDLMAHATI